MTERAMASQSFQASIARLTECHEILLDRHLKDKEQSCCCNGQKTAAPLQIDPKASKEQGLGKHLRVIHADLGIGVRYEESAGQ